MNGKDLAQLPNECLAELIWYGPFLLRDGILVKHPLEPASLPPDTSGLYVAAGDHPFHGKEVPLYIGQTGRFVSQRIYEHARLREEWRPEVYVTDVEDGALRNELEALLIYAHTRIYNPSHTGTP